MAAAWDSDSEASIEKETQYPPPAVVAKRQSTGSYSDGAQKDARISGFSWFRLSVDGPPPGPVHELSLYMGAAFSSIPDDSDSVRSPYFAASTNGASVATWKDSGDRAASNRVVDWDRPHDAENPRNWAMKFRWIQIVLVSILTLQAAVASSMPAPAVSEILAEFKAPEGVLSSFVISIFNLGFVFGPVLAAPMSELYGRYPAYSLSNILFFACNIGCAFSPNLGVLLLFRFLSGCAGAAPLSIGGGTIADVAPTALRGRAVSIYSIAPLLGPVIGPAVGGFIAEYGGWRWIFWTLCIMAGVLGIIMLIVLRETSGKALLEKRTKKIRKRTGDSRYRSALDDGVSPGEAFSRAINRPLRLLFLHPVVLVLSLYFAVIYGYLYLFFTTLATVFRGKYGFSTGSSGLTFIGVGLGTVSGTILVSFWSDRLATTLAEKAGARKPEFRLPLMAYSTPLIPGGLLLYGWTAEKSVFWFIPMIGTAIVGVGIMFVFTPLASYLVDAFTTHAASALAASTILRSIFGAFLPLAGLPLFDGLGLGWGNTILAAVALLMAPIPWVVMRKGEAIRGRYGHCVY
ncbi:MFS multidrug transporter [Colletotrichum truncatum]|uniref:MFS multidrug transporter n=1 Tax=Colletotrichum truncatum TaxID=5467 RepID=A0ACC3Z7R1_COLTU|nr:MFS multidrug transporter [Colletotrichum truncatum]KAF6782504.1 MFS multidrug transporter [Colletotrichum truncatum]